MRRHANFLAAFWIVTGAAAAEAGYGTISGVSLDEYIHHQPIVIEALHLGRQTMVDPGGMSFTPAIWLGTGEHLTGGMGFSFQTAIERPHGYGIALGVLDDRGTSAGIAVSARRSGYTSRRVRVVAQGVLGYQWELDSRQNAVEIEDIPFGSPLEEFLIDDARWISGYGHVISELRFGPFRTVLDVGVLVSSADVDGFILGRDFELDNPDSRSETFSRLTFGTGLALDVGPIDAFLGGVAGDGDGLVQMSLTIRAR